MSNSTGSSGDEYTWSWDFNQGEPVPAEATIPIENAGFEVPELANEDFTLGAVPGWDIYDPNDLVPENPTTETSNVDVFNPSATYYPDEAPQGENVGDVYLVQAPGSGVAGLSQTLDTVLKANTDYTLQVEVGNPEGNFEDNDLTGFPGYRVELLAGDIVLAAEQNNLYIEEGTFSTSEVTFTATADSPYLGQELGIRLVNVLQGPGLQVDFDNVSLTAQALPDTSTTIM